MPKRKRLPIGIQTFSTIRENGYYYVDKTGLILDLVSSGTHYFLSRPRRFGKSLLLDTIKELFAGNQTLFQSLAIHDHWDWSVQYPVLRFSFGRKNYREPEALQESLHQQLSQFEDDFQVKRRFEVLLAQLVQNREAQISQSMRLYDLLMANDFAGLRQLFHSFFASIPHQWYHNNNIQNYEVYYASVFYSYFASLGLHLTVEDSSHLGRIDMTLKFNNQVHIFEFKVVELVPDGKALQQIKDKAYADKYRALGQMIYLIGVEFSKTERNIVDFDWEQAA